MPTCTYCKGTDFFEGPTGGLSINILCANKSCRHWFNWTAVINELDDLHRVEPTDEEKAEATKSFEGTMNLGMPRMRVKIDDIYEEGRTLYREGKSARGCLQEKPYDGYGASQSNMIRLTGWLDALRGLP